MRGEGHLVVDSPELPAEGSDISVTFRTTQMDTLFLLSTTDTSQVVIRLCSSDQKNIHLATLNTADPTPPWLNLSLA